MQSVSGTGAATGWAQLGLPHPLSLLSPFPFPCPIPSFRYPLCQLEGVGERAVLSTTSHTVCHSTSLHKVAPQKWTQMSKCCFPGQSVCVRQYPIVSGCKPRLELARTAHNTSRLNSAAHWAELVMLSRRCWWLRRYARRSVNCWRKCRGWTNRRGLSPGKRCFTHATHTLHTHTHSVISAQSFFCFFFCSLQFTIYIFVTTLGVVMGVGLLVVTIWLDLCTSYGSICLSPPPLSSLSSDSERERENCCETQKSELLINIITNNINVVYSIFCTYISLRCACGACGAAITTDSHSYYSASLNICFWTCCFYRMVSAVNNTR